MREFPGYRRAGTVLLIAVTVAVGAAQAQAPQKKPSFPPPEQSSTVGVLGAHRSAETQAERNAPPPPPVAAPEVPKVDVEPPESLPAAPLDQVQRGGTMGVPASAALRLPGPPPSGFLPDHPLISGLVAGLIGSDLGAKLYGGPMVGDENAALVGYGLRLAIIVALAWALFRAIGNRAGGRAAAPGVSGRREPGFGKGADPASGRREPTFDRTRQK